MYLLRGFVVWLVIIGAETVHGILRQVFIAPIVGDFPARRMAFYSGMLIIFAIAYLFVRWINAANTRELFAVGLLWLILTATFEIGLGYLLGYPRERIFEDYDVRRGGLMGFGMLFLLFAPWAADRLRKRRA